MGKSKRYVYARLELLELSAPVQKALAAGKIEPSHAQELVPLKPEQQKAMLTRIEKIRRRATDMSIEEIRQEISERYTPKKTPKVSAREKARRARESRSREKTPGRIQSATSQVRSRARVETPSDGPGGRGAVAETPKAAKRQSA